MQLLLWASFFATSHLRIFTLVGLIPNMGWSEKFIGSCKLIEASARFGETPCSQNSESWKISKIDCTNSLQIFGDFMSEIFFVNFMLQWNRSITHFCDIFNGFWSDVSPKSALNVQLEIRGTESHAQILIDFVWVFFLCKNDRKLHWANVSRVFKEIDRTQEKKVFIENLKYGKDRVFCLIRDPRECVHRR